MRRILVYGVTGSGKSVAARRISEATGLPYVAVDDLMWEPGWVQVPLEEQRRRMEEVCAAEAWVLDSAYGVWTDIPLGVPDLVVVALDYPRWLSLSRLLRRTAARLVLRDEICNGNKESFRSLFASDSIVRWHFRSFHSKRARIAAWEADPDLPEVIRFRSPRELTRWVRGLNAAPGRRTSPR